MSKSSATSPAKNRLSPLMSQYWGIKQKHPDAILFFRVGDFYETFYEDAVEVSRLLGIALTTRDKNKEEPIPLAGVPHHASEGYIARLVRLGKKVAICDQVEDAAVAKGLVKRAVTEVVTPGTALAPQILEEKENHYCLSLHPDGKAWSFALLDLSTGEFTAGCASSEELSLEIGSLPVREVMLSATEVDSIRPWVARHWSNVSITPIESYYFDTEVAGETLRSHFGVQGPEGFGIAGDSGPAAVSGALLKHLLVIRGSGLDHITRLSRWTGGEALHMDEETVTHLELLAPQRGSPPQSSLLHHLDHTLTSPGGRLLRSWVRRPLRDVEAIRARLDAVEELTRSDRARSALGDCLGGFGDLERLLGRVAAGRANPRDLKSMGETSERIPEIRSLLSGLSADLLRDLLGIIEDQGELTELVRKAIVDEPPAHLRDGGAIRTGYDDDLDRLVLEEAEAKRWIAGLQESERKRTGIPSLKIGYNKVFGYYIEVTKTHKEKVPEDYIRKQTLVQAERFVTPELKEKEATLLSGEAKRIQLEQEIFERLRTRVVAMSESIQSTARGVARLDALRSLAQAALANGYIKPVVEDSDKVRISGGRHPVVERLIEEPFVPNDLTMDGGHGRLFLLTGPNMAGKSTYLRQCALIFVLAQMGSFVPADDAVIGITDRIFTRVGAQDHLAAGRSTFLVEMMETANILNNASNRSFVVLDEIGRGTSTYDGLSIAWAVAEYLAGRGPVLPRTLFATHYHEMTSLADSYPQIRNYRVEVKEWEDRVVFLHRVVPGSADRSYGIHVARLAGLPPSVIDRAGEILASLENQRDDLRAETGSASVTADSGRQLGLFDRTHVDNLLAALDGVDPNQITPLEALALLERIISELRS